MGTVLVFAGALLVAVLLSGCAERTVLSTAVLFLLAGFLPVAAISWRFAPKIPS